MLGPLHLAPARRGQHNGRRKTDQRRFGTLKQKQRKIRLEALAEIAAR
jgi:hypothetical protein